MIYSGKKNSRLARQKKKSNSRVVRKKNSERNKKPFKLNGRSLTNIVKLSKVLPVLEERKHLR